METIEQREPKLKDFQISLASESNDFQLNIKSTGKRYAYIAIGCTTKVDDYIGCVINESDDPNLIYEYSTHKYLSKLITEYILYAKIFIIICFDTHENNYKQTKDTKYFDISLSKLKFNLTTHETNP